MRCCACVWIYISKVKWATIVEGNPKAPFSIATTPRCRGGRYSLPGLLYFTLDPYLIMLCVKQGGIKYHFLSLWYDSTWDWTQVSRDISEHSNRWVCHNCYHCKKMSFFEIWIRLLAFYFALIFLRKAWNLFFISSWLFDYHQTKMAEP